MSVVKETDVLQETSNDLRDLDSIPKYLMWLRKNCNVSVTDREENYYGLVTNVIKRDFQKSSFWIELNEKVDDYDQEYLLRTGYDLVSRTHKPELQVKPFRSLLIKSYRRNVLENKNWPNEPEGGWILPKTWLSDLNDIVRTLFVVKYFDGVNFLIEKINALCKKHEMKSDVSFEAREEGYYAAHIHTQKTFEIPKQTWDTEKTKCSIEIQITTQVQEVLRKLLHKYYEEKRVKLEKPAVWQWNHRSDEFSVNYLGHILHYIEGMILEIRDRSGERDF